MVSFIKRNISKILYKILIAIILCLIYSEISIVKNFNQKQQKAQTLEELTLLVHKFLQNKNLSLDKEVNNYDLAERDSNIAINYYNEWKSYSNSDEWKEKGIDVCDTSLPTIEEIDFNNIFWQTIPNTNKTQYFLYNAYYDNRGNKNNVRIVAEKKFYSENDLK